MSDMNVDQVLAQMRVLAAKAQQGVQPAQEVQESQRVDFSKLLVNSIDAVNEAQQASSDVKKRFQNGDESITVVDIAIASEKSKIAFTAMTEVRKKLVEAYKDVMSMSV